MNFFYRDTHIFQCPSHIALYGLDIQTGPGGYLGICEAVFPAHVEYLPTSFRSRGSRLPGDIYQCVRIEFVCFLK